MIRVLLAAAACVALASCTTTRAPVIVTKNVLVKTPESLMVCPGVRLPDTEGLTDKQVGRLIVQLYTSNEVCRSSIKSIKEFQDKVEAELSQSGG